MKEGLVIAAVGPTASGKTSLSIELAKEFNGEIICCDSMQIYKHMKIGTASPTDEELAQVPHHLFSFVDPKIDYNAAMYQKVAREKIDYLHSQGKIPILCGGTGLYVKGALYDMNFSTASSDDEYRAELENLYKQKGADYIYAMLKENDPKSAAVIHKNNVKRVIRALEIFHISGVAKCEQKQEEKKYYTNSKIIALRHDRQKLYHRINKRVDIMLEQGLQEEVRNLIQMGVAKTNNAMQAIGYKEWIDFFEGTIDLDKCTNNIKKNSRHYAKRQLTWFNRMDIEWFDYDDDILHNLNKIIQIIKN